MTDYVEATSTTSLRFVRTLPGPVERVWQHLVEPELRARWFAGGETDGRVGGSLTLAFDHSRLSAQPPPERYREVSNQTCRCTIVVWEPPHRLAFTWPEGEGQPDSEVTITLSEADDGGVRLELVHARLEQPESRDGAAAGWHAHFELLEDLLGGRRPRDFWLRHGELEAEYATRLA